MLNKAFVILPAIGFEKMQNYGFAILLNMSFEKMLVILPIVCFLDNADYIFSVPVAYWFFVNEPM